MYFKSRFFFYGALFLLCVIALSFGVLMRIILAGDTPIPVISKPEMRKMALPTTLTTDTWGIFDPHTGTLIAGHGVDTPLPIASISKLFTAEAVLESTKKDTSFVISDADMYTEGRAGKLMSGTETTPYQLLFPLLIESSNDAAEAIHRALGVEFDHSIEYVTSTLPLKHTSIRDASGLSPQNVSTVADLSLFYAYLKSTHPHILDITQLRMYVGEDTGYVNNNPGRKLDTFTGGKQGFTDEASRTFVGSFILPDSGREIGVVLLKSDDITQDIQILLQYSAGMYVTSDILSP